MSDRKIEFLLFLTILVVCALPLAAAFYLIDDALQRSLNLGFNPQVVHSLDIAAQNLKTLKGVDPPHEREYRQEFEEIQDLTRIYSQPQWVKNTILGSLKIYFGLGLAGAVLVALLVAAALSRRISHSYRATFTDLMAHRERVRYLEEMSSWQEMAKVLAHEIKNPLTPIEVLVTSLTKAHLIKTSPEFQEQLNQTQIMVAEEIGYLKRTVSRFSDFAKLPEVQLAEANPVDVLAQHLAAVRTRFGTARFVLEMPESRSKIRSRIDLSLFRQVLMNIIANGVEANPASAVTFSIALTTSAEAVRITITNDGEPVPAEIASRIFDPYISSKRDKDNMGLGLAIVKKIIIEHGGEIAYAERAGHPQFIISLPRLS